MRRPVSSTCSLAVVAVVVLVSFGRASAEDAEPPSRPTTSALQVLADLTLIDGACHSEVVNFGIGFRFASHEGIEAAAIMPGGARRIEFESALGVRRASFSRDELCGEIAANYAEALPGSITFSTSARPRP